MDVRTMLVAGPPDLNLQWAVNLLIFRAIIMIPTLVGDLRLLTILTIRVTMVLRTVSIMDPINRQ